jgi:hypothetical protein
VDWVHLVQDKVQCPAIVNTVMDTRIPKWRKVSCLPEGVPAAQERLSSVRLVRLAKRSDTENRRPILQRILDVHKRARVARQNVTDACTQHTAPPPSLYPISVPPVVTSLSSVKHHATKTYGKVEVYLLAFLTAALDVGP